MLTIKMLMLQLTFVLELFLIDFSATESSEVSWKWNMCNFSVELNFIDKSGILNIHNYLMTKNNIKYVLPYQTSACCIIKL